MQRRLFELLRRTVPHVPSEIAARLAIVTGGIAYRSAGTMRAAALHNQSLLLDLPEDDRRVRRAALGAFCTLTRNYVDMLALTSWTQGQVRERTDVCGFERLAEVQARGRGVLAATAHFGNLDAGGQALQVRGLPCAVLAERVKPDWLFDFFVRGREHFGGEVMPLTANPLPQVQHALRAGRLVGIACDWDMQGNGIAVTLPAFPCAIRVPAGIAMLALRNKAPIVPIWTERLADGRTRAVVEPEIDTCPTGNLRADIKRIAGSIAERMLPRLRAQPRQWVLFHPVWETAGPANHRRR